MKPPLQGWKEIADYLERDTRTAQRWEESLGLPVRRHGSAAASVYAYPSEIQSWRASQVTKSGGEAASTAMREQPRQVLIPALAAAGVIAVVLLVIGFGPVLNPPSPIAQAAEDGLRTELVWPEAIGVSPEGSVSADGTLVTYVDWSDEGNLAIRNLDTGENRRLTDSANAVTGEDFYAGFSRISPDSKQVVYTWARPSPVGETGELRLLALGDDAEEPTTIWSPADGSYASVQDWFPSGDRVAAVVRTFDSTFRIVTVPLADGDVQQVRSVDWGGEWPVVRVSPDGRHLAYSRTPSREMSEKDIFLVAVDGRFESAIVKHAANDELVGWSPDGGHIFFNSDRSGRPSLWAQRVDHGAATGEAFLVMSNLDVGLGMGITRDGSLLYPVRVSRQRLRTAEIDMETGKLLQQPINLIERFVGGNRGGVFSPDGGRLAYVSERGERNQVVIVIRSLKTGKERDLRHQMSRIRGLKWRPGSNSLGVVGLDQNGRRGIFSVDATTGETQIIVASTDMVAPQWTPDGMRILHRNDQREGIYYYSLADGSVEGIPGDFGDVSSFSLSPDGRHIATIQGRSEIRLRPVEGGDSRVLVTTDEQHRFGRWTVWTPDGAALLVLKGVRQNGRPASEELWTLWIVPTDGSAPIETELQYAPARPVARPLRIHPDGKRVVYATGGYFQQFWALRGLTFDELEKAAE